MNCPSRTEGITLNHPTWNQNPPFLAADLTTCADLNGIANARERRDGGTGDGGIGDGADEKDYLTHPQRMPDGRPPPAFGGRDNVSHPQKQDVRVGEGHTRSHPLVPSEAARTPSTARGWIAWTASVLVCSTLISSLGSSGFLPSLLSFGPSSASPDNQLCSSASIDGTSFAHGSPLTAAVQSGASSAASPLHQTVKRDACGGGGVNSAEYSVGLHVGALFIMVAVSFFACAFALICKKVSFLRVPPSFFFAVRHFGTGVLLATAFCHLLPTAFIMLGDDCLSSFWIDDYDAMPGAIALAAVFFVAIIEMVFQPARHLIPADAANQESQRAAAEMAEMRRRRSAAAPDSTVTVSTSGSDDDDNAAAVDARGGGAAGTGQDRLPMETGPLHGTANSLGRTLSRMSRNGEITNSPEPQSETTTVALRSKGQRQADVESSPVGGTPHNSTNATVGTGIVLSPAQQHQKDILQCMMLEVGILFHSIFIGMTLAVTPTGSSAFVVLLVAIVFHQTFEGLALGSRIANINWHSGAAQPWLMALAYGCTTPLGQAIGIGTHSLYDPDSEFGLILVGTMNAISSGLLVFASLVELLSEDFLSDESWRCLRGKRRVVACLLVFAGAFGMSVVGAWA